jgi:hypothetical protein
MTLRPKTRKRQLEAPNQISPAAGASVWPEPEPCTTRKLPQSVTVGLGPGCDLASTLARARADRDPETLLTTVT